MALTEKQAWIIGGGALAALLLVKSKANAKPLTAAQKAAAAKKAGGSVVGTASSAARPSTNLATRNATSIVAQNPSTIGIGKGRVSVAPGSPVDRLLGKVFSLFGPKPATSAQSKPATSSAPKSSSGGGGPSAGGGSGGGSSQAQKAGYQSPGGNPWSSAGDFTGRSSVTNTYDPSQFYNIDPETGMPYEDQGPRLPETGMDADGSTEAGDPVAVQDDYYGPVLPAGYDPETGTWDDQGPQIDDPTWQGPIDDPDWQGPVDQAPLDASPLPDFYPVDGADYGDDSNSYWEGGGDGSSWQDDQGWAE